MKILLVDDHAMFREVLRHILHRLSAEVEIHEAGSIEQGLALQVPPSALDLVLLDLLLPGVQGLDGLTALKRCYPSSPVVLLSGLTDPNLIREAMRGGAQGFISKSIHADAMLEALRRVLEGELWFSQQDMQDGERGLESEPTTGSGARTVSLTPRQRDVLLQLSEGHSNKEIGRRLMMSENTVRSHVASVFRSLGARSRTEAVILARRKALL